MSRKNRARRSKLRLIREQRRVSVLVPCDDYVKKEFFLSMCLMFQTTLMAQPKNLSHLVLQPYSTSILPYSRQQLAQSAVDTGATHTLWIDADMMFPIDLLIMLLQRDEPIIGVNATSRRPPFRNTAQVEPRVELNTTEESTGTQRVHRTGFGVLWVATEVYKSLELPWFDFEWMPEFNCWRGEDYYFCEKVQAAGYDVLVDHDISKKVFHVGSFGFNPLLLKYPADRQSEQDAPENEIATPRRVRA